MKQTKLTVQWTVVWVSSRKAVLAFEAGGAYQTAPYSVRIASRDGVRQFTSDKMVLTIDALLPDTGYDLEASRDGVPFATVHLRTAQESAVLNVRKFGAAGDGTRDDTLAIQAAISCCPPQGIVRIPAGRYAVTSLFLKSNTTIELEENAVLLGATRREDLAIVPGMLPCWDDTQEVNLGSWEGNPLLMFTAMLHGQNVENVAITGKGILDGQASYENWWHGFRQVRGAYRPRMVFLNRCRNVLLEGFTTRNSPAWNLHPYFSDDVKLLNLTVENPKNSPNTDGLDIESCRRTLVQGVHFSVGDDCIAVKSGKIYMGQRYKRPTEDLIIRNCLMENGHGGVTIGSEIAAGAQRVLVQDCVFRGTDRGLRIKTRRGRGRDSVLDEIVFRRIRMEDVVNPFVVNSFYNDCDPDGRTDYVSGPNPQPVDERTPQIKTIRFEDIEAVGAHGCGFFIRGLPESRIKRLSFRNISLTFSPAAHPVKPALMRDAPTCCRKGMDIANVETLALANVRLHNAQGEEMTLQNVGCVQK